MKEYKHRSCQSLQDHFRKVVLPKIHLQKTKGVKHFPFSREDLELFTANGVERKSKSYKPSRFGSVTQHSLTTDSAIIKMMLANIRDNCTTVKFWEQLQEKLVRQR